ncbi:MAG: biotin synthase BioB [Pseudomonadota bacterium]
MARDGLENTGGETTDGETSGGGEDAATADIRHDWTRAEAEAIFALPLMELLYRAQSVHRRHFDPNRVQMSRLLSIKTGGCPEDCAYCSQSATNGSTLSASKLIEVARVVAEAKKAKAAGATRYCMGAAWRSPKDRDMAQVLAMVRGVKALGMETCMTLGMLEDHQVASLAEAGLDYYNHNIDTSERYYAEVITTRTFQDRLDTLERVRASGMKVCAGGIVGMGEERMDRVDMLVTLANLSEHPESVPINMLIAQENTPLANQEKLDEVEFVRAIATARILMPKSHVRIAAGRTAMSDSTQAMCFFAGANSIFIGDKLLTSNNPEEDVDRALFDKLGIVAMEAHEHEPRDCGALTAQETEDRAAAKARAEAAARGAPPAPRLRSVFAAE